LKVGVYEREREEHKRRGRGRTRRGVTTEGARMQKSATPVKGQVKKTERGERRPPLNDFIPEGSHGFPLDWGPRKKNEIDHRKRD